MKSCKFYLTLKTSSLLLYIALTRTVKTKIGLKMHEKTAKYARKYIIIREFSQKKSRIFGGDFDLQQ